MKDKIIVESELVMNLMLFQKRIRDALRGLDIKYDDIIRRVSDRKEVNLDEEGEEARRAALKSIKEIYIDCFGNYKYTNK